ncbi:MAG TPA: signal peptidase I [Verrucomicrobiae bacterium]|jgi:signal peptidase I
MILRRFFSRAVREATAMRKHVQRLLNAQRDLLPSQAIAAIQSKIDELNAAIAEGANTGKINIATEELQFAGEKWIKAYPNSVWRENVEVLLVAIAVAMGIRTFFLQPFKIPTGSMQPTLYGITSEPDFSYLARFERSYNINDLPDPEKAKIQAAADEQAKMRNSMVIPTGLERLKEWIHGISYVHFVAPEDGTVDEITKPWPGTIFNLYQRIEFAGKWYNIMFPPDCGEVPLQYRAGLTIDPGRVYKKGEVVVNLRVHSGDHLFVDRLTYNFRPPERGEVVVFETSGIPEDQREQYSIPPDEFYIKRLCGLGGETISLEQNYLLSDSPQGSGQPVGHLVVNGRPLSTSTQHFENLYSFYGAKAGATTLEYHENHYYGHWMTQRLAPGQEVHIAPGNAFMMGDNTMDSLDSRYWGDIPRSSIIGKSFFVYWPISSRFGVNGD